MNGKNKRAAIIVTSALSLFGCAQKLNDITSLLNSTKQVLASTGNIPSLPRAAGLQGDLPAMPRMAEYQTQTLRAQISTKSGDNALAQAREDAKPTIEKILAISACCPDYTLQRYLAAYSVPEMGYYEAPMPRMQYHPKSQCLSVTRIDSWKMTARNAFSFRAIYVSEPSGESRSIVYEMIKEPDGTWLQR